MNTAALATGCALACLTFACRKPPVARGTDPEGASYVPAGTIVLAGVDLDRLRAAPLYSKLPAKILDLAGQFAMASSALLAYNGKDVLAIARGAFAQAPPGATLAARNLAIFGPPELVAAAIAQHRSGAAGAPALLGRAESIARDRQIRIVVQGGASLPLTGNAANLNHLLRNAEFATISGKVDTGLMLEATVIGRTADGARDIEETERAEITLAGAAAARQPELATLLRSIRIDREDRSVRFTLTAGPDAAAKLLAALGR